MNNHTVKEEIQTLLFPKGIYYDRENDAYRTEKVNTVFIINAYVAERLEAKQKRKRLSQKSNF